VLFNRPFEYQSGEDLFVDWTRQDGFEGVAFTAYRSIAERVVNELFSVPSTPPLLLGTGQPVRARQHLLTQSQHAAAPLLARSTTAQLGATVRFADYRFSDGGAFEIFPEPSGRPLQIQGLVDKRAAAAEEVTDTEYTLDGLVNHRNFVVQIAACTVAIPL